METLPKTGQRGALERRERPHAHDHDTSLERRFRTGIQPKGLPELVRWFRERCAEELPDALHKPGIWRDHGTDATGGSALGSPDLFHDFRRLIEGVPWQTDPDGYYRFPLRAALSQLHRGKPFASLHLFRLALCDGDWRRHADSQGWTHEEMEVYIEGVLYLLWRTYSEQPLRMGA
jgi:hypothetical protein